MYSFPFQLQAAYVGPVAASPGRYACLKCPNCAADDAASVWRHARIVHLRIRPYHCQPCESRFADPEAFEEHLSETHFDMPVEGEEEAGSGKKRKRAERTSKPKPEKTDKR